MILLVGITNPDLFFKGKMSRSPFRSKKTMQVLKLTHDSTFLTFQEQDHLKG